MKEHVVKGLVPFFPEHAIDVSSSYGITVLIAILLDKNPVSISLLTKFSFSMWGSMPGIAKIDGQQADHLYYGLNLK